ncbi:MAG: NADPH-dependent F420 reductase [Anaerolineae bacterium]|nr:NADPH-dependent F420 reductase [Anaerolineae bacterium]HNS39136.1 NADPH-dependent F420 reductase [Promineifilum sp.]
MKIAILGGTGSEGSGLGFRWAAAGHEVIIGSRLAEKGERVAAELQAELPRGTVRGTDNITATHEADLLVLSVPYAAQEATLADVRDAAQGKMLITVVAPLGQPKARVWRLPSGMSAAEEAQQQLGEGVTVVAAFQNISATHLRDLDEDLDCDVLICGEKAADKAIAAGLCRDAGMRGINAGALANASVIEGLTAVMLGINVRNKISGAGIRITGLPEEAV